MSLVTQMIVAEKYGARLNTKQLGELLGLAPRTINNQTSAGTFPIPTYVEGGARWADFRDVADYLDSCRARALADAGLPA